MPHEGSPSGVPESYDWAFMPRVGMGNDPQNFRALTAWGQLYEDVSGHLAEHTRVQIKSLKTYLLSKQDHEWHLIQRSPPLEGAAYLEDFSNDQNVPADIRYESDDSISVKMKPGYNFHFWTSPRVIISPDDIGGIFTTVQARLIIDKSSQIDDRAQARYLLSMGGDYWLDESADWDNFQTNNDIAIGRFKYVDSWWKSFNMITLTEAEIRETPPPAD